MLYIVLVIAAGFYAAGKRKSTSIDYFMGGRNLSWPIIGTSLFATSLTIPGLLALMIPGKWLPSSFVSVHTTMIFILLVLGWLFYPLYSKSSISTVTEYFHQRFNRRLSVIVSGFQIFMNIIIRLLFTLYIGCKFLNVFLGWDFLTTAVVIVVLTGLYTIIGGMRAVTYTSVIQVIFFVVLTGVFLWQGTQRFSGMPNTGFHISAHYSLFANSGSGFESIGTELTATLPVIFLVFTGIDQFIVQRLMSAKSSDNARRAILLAAFLILITLVMMLILSAGISSAADNFANLMSPENLPSGLRGLLLTGTLTFMMANLSNIFLTTASLITFDFYRPSHPLPKTGEKKHILIGRLITTYITIAAVLAVPLISIFNRQFLHLLQKLPLLLAAPILAIFIISLINRAATARNAFIGIIAGSLPGLLWILLGVISNQHTAVIYWYANLPVIAVILFQFGLTAVIMPLSQRLIGETAATPGKIYLISDYLNWRDFIHNWRHVLFSILLFLAAISLFIAF